MILRESVLLVSAMLAALTEPAVRQGGYSTRPLRMMSVPVSPSVVATAATSEGRLVLLVLWRGAPLWHASGSRRSAQGGGDQSGRITATLQYGDHQADLSFDPAAQVAMVQGKATTVPATTNVLLVDGINGSRGGALTKALSIDATGVDLDPRLGLAGWVPLLGRSQEIVEFLQCDAVPVDPRSVEPCQYLKKP